MDERRVDQRAGDLSSSVRIATLHMQLSSATFVRAKMAKRVEQFEPENAVDALASAFVARANARRDYERVQAERLGGREQRRALLDYCSATFAYFIACVGAKRRRDTTGVR